MKKNKPKLKKLPLKVVIKTRKWLRGDVPEGTCLRNDEGKMCCLGFAMNQVCGVKFDDLEQNSSPEDVYYRDISKNPKKFVSWPHPDTMSNNNFSTKAMEINDECTISDEERMAKLKSLFRKYDIDLRFEK